MLFNLNFGFRTFRTFARFPLVRTPDFARIHEYTRKNHSVRRTPSAASETREARGLGREPSRIVEEDGLPP